MVLPTMVPPSAFFSMGWSTTLTSDSLSLRRASSIGFFTPWGAAWLVPPALTTPAEESVVLRSVGIWAAPVEVICLRLLAAPLRAGLQFYAISIAIESLVPYDPGFWPRLRTGSDAVFPAFGPVIPRIPPSCRLRYQKFLLTGPFWAHFPGQRPHA